MSPAIDRQRQIFFGYLDIDGATEYKYETHRGHWKAAFLHFFEDFPDYLGDAQKTLFARLKHPQLQPLNFWKALGDGIVYTGEFATPNEAYAYSKAFYNASVHFNDYLFKRSGLWVKAASWFATFPEVNLAIKTPAGEDYLGPDIDIGFRLAAHALSQRMLVAMDLAYELTFADFVDELDFYHVGWRKMKGVAKDKPYPVLMITGRAKPEIPIWESYLNDLTRNYIEGSPLSPGQVRDLIDRYKRDLHFEKDRI
ncbi:MAG: hypothetical protein RRB13_15605 [bacterium]|nr:hypothetical protein [bacterium]